MSFKVCVTAKEYAKLLEAVQGWDWWGKTSPYRFACDMAGFKHPVTGLEFEVIDVTMKGFINKENGEILPAECVCGCGCCEENCYYCGECEACGGYVDEDFQPVYLEFYGDGWAPVGNYWEPGELDEILEMITAQKVTTLSVPEIVGELVKDAVDGSNWFDRFTCWGDGPDMGDDFRHSSGLLTRPGVDGFMKVSDSRVDFCGALASVAEGLDLMDGNNLDSFLSWVSGDAAEFPKSVA